MSFPRMFKFANGLFTIKQIAKKVGMKPKTLSEKIRLGKSIGEAIIKADRQNNFPVHCKLSRQLQESFVGESICTY